MYSCKTKSLSGNVGLNQPMTWHSPMSCNLQVWEVGVRLPGRVIPNTKNGTKYIPAWHSAIMVKLGGANWNPVLQYDMPSRPRFNIQIIFPHLYASPAHYASHGHGFFRQQSYFNIIVSDYRPTATYCTCRLQVLFGRQNVADIIRP